MRGSLMRNILFNLTFFQVNGWNVLNGEKLIKKKIKCVILFVLDFENKWTKD